MNWSPYGIMWIFLFFDLPTNTKQEKRLASKFRVNLEKKGFQMFQFSVYTRVCGSRKAAELKIEKVKKLIPCKDRVSMMIVTDKQYGDIVNIWNAKEKYLESPDELILF